METWDELRDLPTAAQVRGLLWQGRAEPAVALGQRLFKQALDTGEEAKAGVVLSELASAFALSGRGEEAIPILKEWLSASVDPYVCFRLCQSLAQCHRYLNSGPDLDLHERYSHLGFEHAERTGALGGRACARVEIALALMGRNDQRIAQELLLDALSLVAEVRDGARRGLPYAASLGFSLAQGGDIAQAVRVLSHAIGMSRVENAPTAELPSRVYLADAMLELRRPRDAEFHLRVALSLERSVSAGPSWAPKILHLLGDSLKMQRRSRDALCTFRKLQGTYYHHEEGIAEVLMEVEARKKIRIL